MICYFLMLFLLYVVFDKLFPAFLFLMFSFRAFLICIKNVIFDNTTHLFLFFLFIVHGSTTDRPIMDHVGLISQESIQKPLCQLNFKNLPARTDTAHIHITQDLYNILYAYT
jgi:hypothetical protein